MKNLNRIFLIVLSVLVVQGVGGVAFAQTCVVPDSGDPSHWDFDAIPADGEETKTFTLTAACLWKPTGVLPETDPWITILEYKWTGGTGYVTYQVEDNLTDSPRDGSILVEGVVVHTVHQAANCVVEFFNAPLGADSVFVTSTACGEVIGFGPTGPPAWDLVYGEPGSNYEGLVYGPDEQLYTCDPGVPGAGGRNGKIFRVDTAEDLYETGDGGVSIFPQCGWFTPDGSLVVTDTNGTGVYILPNSGLFGDPDPIILGIPELISDSDGPSYEGVTMAANGDLLVIDSTNATVKKFVYDPVGPSYTESSTAITTNSLGVARTSNGDIFVGYDDSLSRYDSDGNFIASCTDAFGVGGLINFINTGGALPPDSYESLYVATVNDDVGTLWEIPFDYDNVEGTTWDCGSSRRKIATLTGIGSAVHPLTGVAVQFTKREGKLMAANPDPVPPDSELFNFFDSLYEFRPEYVDGFDGDLCEYEATAKQVSAARLQELIDTHVGMGAPIIFAGDDGRGLIFDYELVSNPNCTPTIAEQKIIAIQHSINAYYFGASSPTPVVCSGDETDAYGCYATTFLSDSSVGLLPKDGRTSGRGSGDFSFAFLMDRAPPAGGYVGNFCGFKSPLDDATIDSPLTVAAGSTVPIGFTVSDANKNCKKGPFLDGITVVLSVTKISPDVEFLEAEDIHIVGGGSSDEGRIVFNQPISAKKGFELQFKAEYADGTPFEPGAIFELTVVDDSGMYFPLERTYIQIAQ